MADLEPSSSLFISANLLVATVPSITREAPDVVAFARSARAPARLSRAGQKPIVVFESRLSQRLDGEENSKRLVESAYIESSVAHSDGEADGNTPKRRGPKPDSKPALTRRQELNRQAQR